MKAFRIGQKFSCQGKNAKDPPGFYKLCQTMNFKTNQFESIS